ncbi:MAG: type II secretion system protein [Patescibacteria group bacterium]
MQNKNHKNKTLGFTLIEIMVAVSIFALVMVVAIGAVLSVVAANKKAQALNSVITNLNFALEGMMRDLRTGYDYDCDISTVELDDCVSSAGNAVVFTSAQSANQKVIYSLNTVDHAIYKKVADENAYSMTAPEVKVEKLDFYVTGTAHGESQDNRQPKILIIIQGEYTGYGDVAKFSLQTMVSQRKLDI